MALPRSYVVTPHGRYLIASTVELKQSVLAGEDAAKRREEEVGKKGATFGQGNKNPRELSPQLLADSVSYIRDNVGEAFDKLIFSDLLGQQSTTPPRARHPLAEVVELVRAGTVSLTSSSPGLDARAVIEVDFLVHTLKRWNRHPLWPKIVAALINEYSHTVITLAAASFLEDAGNGVILHEPAGTRAPDLMLVTGPKERAAIEVKAPRILRWRGHPLSKDEASNIVAVAMKKAGTGKKGQLGERQAGLLLLGGFHLSMPDVVHVETAATDYLSAAARKGRHENLLGIAILSLGAIIEQDAGSSAPSSLGGMINVRIAKHPRCRGDIRLESPPSFPE
jgi:hypothetical protein